MDENHKIPALLPFKTVKGLTENVDFKEDGTMEVGAGMDVDGKIKINDKKDLVGPDGNPLLDGNGNSPILEISSKADAEAHLNEDGMFFTRGIHGVDLIVGRILQAQDDHFTIKGTVIEAAVGGGSYSIYGYKLGVKYTGKLDGYDHIHDIPNTETIKNDILPTYYQHTVVIKGTGQYGCHVVFTATSKKNLNIDSYQDLHTVFGGCNIAGSGEYSENTNPGGSVILNLHGGTLATDKFIFQDGTEVAFDSFAGGLTFTDDVWLPK